MKASHYAISSFTNFNYVHKLGITCGLVTRFVALDLGQIGAGYCMLSYDTNHYLIRY